MTDSFLFLLSFFFSQSWVSAFSGDFPEDYNPGDSLLEKLRRISPLLLPFLLCLTPFTPFGSFSFSWVALNSKCSPPSKCSAVTFWSWDIFNRNIFNIGCAVLWISIGHSFQGISRRLTLFRSLLNCISTDRPSLKQHTTLPPYLNLPCCLYNLLSDSLLVCLLQDPAGSLRSTALSSLLDIWQTVNKHFLTDWISLGIINNI